MNNKKNEVPNVIQIEKKNKEISNNYKFINKSSNFREIYETNHKMNNLYFLFKMNEEENFKEEKEKNNDNNEVNNVIIIDKRNKDLEKNNSVLDNDNNSNNIINKISTTTNLSEITNYYSNGKYSIKISIWFGIIYIFFFIADTICNIPYSALAPELSSNPVEREKIFFVFYIFQYLGILAAVTGPVILQYLIFNKCDFSGCELPEYQEDAHLYTMCKNIKQQNCNNQNNLSSLRGIAFYISFHYIFTDTHPYIL